MTAVDLAGGGDPADDHAERADQVPTNVIEHLEHHLGPLARGWGSPGEPVGVQVALFESQPIEGVVSYATLGLSRHRLAMHEGREVRQELVFSVAERFADELLPMLLLYVAERIVREHRAVLAGEVFPLGYRVCAGSGADSLYVSVPVVFPDEMAVYEGSDPKTIVAWLFPVLPPEVALVDREGWPRFEELLERADPDLFDLTRESIV